LIGAGLRGGAASALEGCGVGSTGDGAGIRTLD